MKIFNGKIVNAKDFYDGIYGEQAHHYFIGFYKDNKPLTNQEMIDILSETQIPVRSKVIVMMYMSGNTLAPL